MENKRIKTELLKKYLGQKKELLDFVKNDKELFGKTLNKVKIYHYLGYYVVEFYIEQNSYYKIFEIIFDKICNSNETDDVKNHLIDCLNKLEPISIDFQVSEKEMSVKDVYLEGHKEWDFEITLLKSLDYIFDNCERI